MQRTEPPLIATAICLAALAGFIDALAFVQLGGFFASSMSGNSTRLGVSLATGLNGDAITAGALILSFVSGAMLATVIARARPGDSMAAGMAAVTLLLLAAAAAANFAPGMIALLLLAVAMGAMHGLLHRQGGVPADATALTASLVRLGEDLAGALMGDADRWAWLRHLLLWSGFVSGAVLGVRAFAGFGAVTYWAAAFAAAALLFAVRTRAPADRSG